MSFVPLFLITECHCYWRTYH